MGAIFSKSYFLYLSIPILPSMIYLCFLTGRLKGHFGGFCRFFSFFYDYFFFLNR